MAVGATVDIVDLDGLSKEVLTAITTALGRAVVAAAKPHVPYADGGLRKSGRSRVVFPTRARITYRRYDEKIADRTRRAVLGAAIANRSSILKRVAAAGDAALKRQER